MEGVAEPPRAHRPDSQSIERQMSGSAEKSSRDGYKLSSHETIVLQKRTKPTVVQKVRNGQRTIICEFDPPKDLDTMRFLQGAKKLKQAGVDAVTMADNSLATARMSNLALGAILKNMISSRWSTWLAGTGIYWDSNPT